MGTWQTTEVRCYKQRPSRTCRVCLLLASRHSLARQSTIPTQLQSWLQGVAGACLLALALSLPLPLSLPLTPSLPPTHPFFLSVFPSHPVHVCLVTAPDIFLMKGFVRRLYLRRLQSFLINTQEVGAERVDSASRASIITDPAPTHWSWELRNYGVDTALTDPASTHWSWELGNYGLDTALTDLASTHWSWELRNYGVDTALTDLAPTHWSWELRNYGVDTALTDPASTHWSWELRNYGVDTALTDPAPTHWSWIME